MINTRAGNRTQISSFGEGAELPISSVGEGEVSSFEKWWLCMAALRKNTRGRNRTRISPFGGGRLVH